MKVVKTVAEVREYVKKWRMEGATVGLVPTMGYLHEGHKSLVVKSVSENDHTVVSVFVNPIQFGVGEDLESYPRDLEADSKLCEAAGADIIFNPEPSEMYPDGFVSYVDMDGLTNALCGLSRPTHFRGVCTVVSKLFNIITPDKAYFGEKDAQQLAVIKRFVKDLNFGIEIVGCPIVREEDGLAKSSRNTYLSVEGRKAALLLSKSIFGAKRMVEDGERSSKAVTDYIRSVIAESDLLEMDYAEVVDVNTMKSIDVISGEILCAIAVKVKGEARLIDNFMMTV